MSTPTGLVPALQIARATRAHRGPRAGHKPLPLPSLAPAPATPSAWTHRVVILDGSGRILDAACWAAAGLRPGLGVTVTDDAGTLTVSRDGPTELDARGRLKIPAPARTWRGWTAGTALLISATPGRLVVRAAAALDALVTPEGTL